MHVQLGIALKQLGDELALLLRRRQACEFQPLLRADWYLEVGFQSVLGHCVPAARIPFCWSRAAAGMLRDMADGEAWSKRVADWRASGLTAKEFCAKHDLQLSGLRYWTYRLRAAEKASETSAVKLVPVTVKPEEVSPSMPAAERREPVITVEIGAARIVVPTSVDRATLKLVLELLSEHQARVTR